jgi:hypothetical protein
MRNRIIFKKYFFLAALVSLLFTSCEKEELLQGPERLFRPIVKESIISGTWFRIKWDKYDGAVAYQMELSTDTFKTILKSYRTDSTAYTFSDLEYDLNYQMRIRSVGDSIIASGDSIRSDYHVYNIKTIDYPTYLKAPLSTDILDKSIRVKWSLSATTYTRFDVMLSRDSLYKSYTISAEENLLGEKIINGLEAGTTYLVMIYEGDLYKGKKTFKTNPAQIFEGDVVDLRDLTDDMALSKITQLYIDSLGTLYPSGFNLVLSGGTKYIIPTINIPVSVNFVTGLSFKGKAIMAINGNFGIKAATTVASVKMDKIFFTEGTIAGKFRTDANFGGAYLFNFNQLEGHATNITLENCDIKYKRGVCRLQTKAKVELFTISNCVIDSIGGYGIVNMDNADALVNNVILRNSTFSHFDGYLCRDTKSTLMPNSILVENITTCYSPANTRYLFELTDRVLAGGVTLRNSIFGSVLVAAGATTATTVNGLRVGAGTSVTIDNCFKTSDLVWSIPVGGTMPSYPIADCVELGKTSAEIFADPTVNNYKVSLTSLVKKAGDPRWW